MSLSLIELLPFVRNIALRASIAVQAIQDSPEFTVTSKGEQGPLTSADLLADEICRRDLMSLDGEAGWLSEETADDLARLDKQRVWIVDPIDGTREFVKRVPEYSVSIGLSADGLPVLGAVAMPARKRIVYGGPGLGLFLETYAFADDAPAVESGKESETETQTEPETKRKVEIPGYGDYKSHDGGNVLPSGDTIHLLLRGGPVVEAKFDASKDVRPLALVSRSEAKKGKFEGMEDDYRLEPSGSIARKLALTALGEGDLNFSVYPKNEWDICGGIALVLARPGRSVVDLEKFEPHRFNRRDTISYGLAAGSTPQVRRFTEYFQRGKLKLEKRYD